MSSYTSVCSKLATSWCGTTVGDSQSVCPVAAAFTQQSLTRGVSRRHRQGAPGVPNPQNGEVCNQERLLSRPNRLLHLLAQRRCTMPVSIRFSNSLRNNGYSLTLRAQLFESTMRNSTESALTMASKASCSQRNQNDDVISVAQSGGEEYSE